MKKRNKIILFSVIGFLLVAYIFFYHYSPQTSSTYKEINLDDLSVATFAGGCFWCVESAFEEYSSYGVVEVISGYAGGSVENPSYIEVSSGVTDHVEAVQVYYDNSQISYSDLLQIFWRQIDPTDPDGSFVDRGFQYTSAIFYSTNEELEIIEQSILELESSNKFDQDIVTRIEPFTSFYEAEEYHQDYHSKSPLKYKAYRFASGRDQYREAVWGDDKDYTISEVYTKPSDEEIKEMLTPLQYEVTQNEATEKPFYNEYWDNEEPGIYVDIVSGEPLYSSTDKFKSGTGWPSFTKALTPGNIVERTDYKLIYPRTELRSKIADSHLGHKFNDAPIELGGIRHCINSAALRFIHADNLEKEGYEEYLFLFDN